jgi:hypothetical protein
VKNDIHRAFEWIMMDERDWKKGGNALWSLSRRVGRSYKKMEEIQLYFRMLLKLFFLRSAWPKERILKKWRRRNWPWIICPRGEEALSLFYGISHRHFEMSKECPYIVGGHNSVLWKRLAWIWAKHNEIEWMKMYFGNGLIYHIYNIWQGEWN